MKNLSTKVICSVETILAIVFNTSSNLTTSQRDLEHIANLEGCRTQSYQCSANVWTLGLGHTSNVKRGDTATNEQLARNLIADVQSAECIVNKHFSFEVTQAQLDIL